MATSEEEAKLRVEEGEGEIAGEEFDVQSSKVVKVEVNS
jgi:hypothetical protein